MFMSHEYIFALDQETKLPVDFVESVKMESKALVEEFMLLANILVAEQIFKFCK